jgi:hypothetical protein
MARRSGRISDSTIEMMESYCDHIDALYKFLHSVAHKETSVEELRERVSELLRDVEAALRLLL